MPEEIVIAAVEWATEGELVLTAAEAATAVAASAAVASIYQARQAQRKALEDQRNAYNASLRDRYVMYRGATEGRQVVLGRQRVSGPLAYVGSYGTTKEHLVFAVPIAAHEIDAVEAIYFDSELVSIDGSGNVIAVQRREYFSISTSGAVFTITTTPQSGSVTAVAKYGTTSVSLGVSVAGTAITVSGATNGVVGTVTITYYPDPSPFTSAANSFATIVQDLALDGSGNGTLALMATPRSGSLKIVLPGSGNGDMVVGDQDLTSFGSVGGTTLTVTGATAGASQTVKVNYQNSTVSNSKARVSWHLGAAGQTADAAMITALPGVWTSAHVGNSIAYLKVELDYDPDAFPNGLPNVSALVRGAKLYDPRTGLTAWSENPVLMMRYVALSPLLGRLSSSYINDTNISACANVCDASVTYTVQSQNYVRAKYTAGLVTKSGVRPADVMNDLAQAMCGKWAEVDGQLRIRAGAYSTPLQTLTDLWLIGANIQIQPRPNRADVINVVTGKFADERNDYQVLDFPRAASSTYITQDGIELPQDVQLNAVTFTGQAQQIAATMIRDARQGMRVTLTCNMRAYPVEVFDNLYVTIARFGWTNKVFEVVDVAWMPDAGIQLTLKETDSTIWDMGTTFADSDPAPNTSLRSPFSLDVIAGLTCVSSGQYMTLADGTISSRIKATWTAVTDPGVLADGGIEVRYGLASQSEDQCQSVFVPYSQNQAFLPALIEGGIYLVRARTYNQLVKGQWCAPVLHKVAGKTTAPTAVASLTATAIPGFIRLIWTAGVDPTEAGVDLGRGASWGAATGLEGQAAKSFAAGVGVNTYDWAWPAPGSYTVRAKRRDTSGNQSSEVTLGVTVTATGIAVDWSSGITGTGKPADNATKNVVTYSASAPGSPTDGDLWCDTSGAPVVWKIRVSGAWQLAANYSTGALAQLSSVDTSQINAGAATAVLKDLIPTATYASTLSGLGIATVQTNNSLSYTNTTGGSVEVEISWSAALSLTMGASPTGSASCHGPFIEWTVNGSAGTFSDPLGFDVPNITQSQNKTWRLSNVWHLTLAAGDVFVVKTTVQLQGTALMNYSLVATNAALKFNVLKR